MRCAPVRNIIPSAFKDAYLFDIAPQLCEEKEYGLYTLMARTAAAERDKDDTQLKKYRQM